MENTDAPSPVPDPEGSIEARAEDEVVGAGTDEPTRRRGVTIDQLIATLLALVGLRSGLEPLHDNSFFTHLATGRIILDTGSIPRVDPYSFTALGEPWTVQSWGASVIYAAIDNTVGLVGIRILVAAISTAMAVLIWQLIAPAKSLVGRLAIAVPVITIGLSYWVERPLIFSLLFLMAVLFAIEGRLDPRWLVPIMFLWVNIHGSFPIGLAAIGVYGVGRLLDRERPTVEVRAFAWALLGTLLGALNPLGWRLLVFPLDLLQNREAFAQVVEWQPPQWQDWGERFFAIQLALAIVLVLWRARCWRNIVPIIVFGAISLQSTRNIAQASLVLLPVLAAGVAGLGNLDGSRSLPIFRPVRIALFVLMGLVFATGVTQVDLELVDYPVESAEWMKEHGHLDIDDRVVSRDFVGNYLEVKYYKDPDHRVPVFIDDRVDMYPIEVIADYTTLIDPDGDFQDVLDRAGATAVLWDHGSDFGDWLEDPANGWKIVHRDRLWLVAVPVSSSS